MSPLKKNNLIVKNSKKQIGFVVIKIMKYFNFFFTFYYYIKYKALINLETKIIKDWISFILVHYLQFYNKSKTSLLFKILFINNKQ